MDESTTLHTSRSTEQKKKRQRVGQQAVLNVKNGGWQLTTTSAVEHFPSAATSSRLVQTRVPGFYLWTDFITPEEEGQLVEHLLLPTQFSPLPIRGRSQRDGRRQTYSISRNGDNRWGEVVAIQSSDCGGTSLQLLQDIGKRIVQVLGPAGSFPGLDTYDLLDVEKTGLVVNVYNNDRDDHHHPHVSSRPKQGEFPLPFHFDDRYRYKEYLFGLSLEGDCVFSLRRPTGSVIQKLDRVTKATGDDGSVESRGVYFSSGKLTTGMSLEQEDFPLPRRSIYVMSGAARYQWQHGICPNNILGDRRLSVTIRGIK